MIEKCILLYPFFKWEILFSCAPNNSIWFNICICQNHQFWNSNLCHFKNKWLQWDWPIFMLHFLYKNKKNIDGIFFSVKFFFMCVNEWIKKNLCVGWEGNATNRMEKNNIHQLIFFISDSSSLLKTTTRFVL